MKKKTRKQELVARPHLVSIVFLFFVFLGVFFEGKKVKIHLNRNGTKFPIVNNGLHL